MKIDNEKKRLTLEQVAEILLQKDIRTVRSYIEKGWIPQIAYNKEDMSVDAVLLAEQMGVENFDEPFITEDQAIESLNFESRHKFVHFCQKNGINVYRLANKIGVRYLFRASDLQKCLDLELTLLPFALEQSVRRNTLSAISETLSALAVLVDDERGLRIITSYLEGSSVDEIHRNYSNLTRERVRQILASTLRRVNHRAKDVKKWIHVFSKTKYSQIPPGEVLNLINELQAQNSFYKEKFDKILNGADPKQVLAEYSEPEDIERNKLLNMHISDLDLGVRAYNMLKAAEITILGELVSFHFEDLLKFRNVGKKTETELRELVNEKGLKFKGE